MYRMAFDPFPTIELLIMSPENELRYQSESVSIDANSFRPPPPQIGNPKRTRVCPGGEDKLVLYTTSLQVVPKTFEECNKVRTAIKEVGFVMFERDVSTKKFRGEFRELMEDKGVVPPTPVVFVKGTYVGGFEEVSRFEEAGTLGKMLRGVGLPQKIDGTSGSVCEGCGGAISECRNCKGGTKKVKLQLVGGGTASYSCHGCRGTGLEYCSTCTYVADPSVSN